MEEGIRVFTITNTYPTDEEPGATPCVKDQISALGLQGIRVELYYIDRRNKLNYFRAAWKVFLMSFQRKRYDLIHAHYGHSGLIALFQLKYPVVVSFHGSDLLSRRDRIIGKIAARGAEGVIVMTEEMKLASQRQDAHVIPFGVNTDLFAPYPLEEARSELGLPLDDKLILFPWNPSRRVKRFDVIQSAVQIVRQRHGKVRLVTVFDQPREVFAKYMNACDVMVLASDREGSPMAVREAMACNLPIVTVDVGDVRQVVEGTDGCYLCTRDPMDMAEKLAWVLDRGQRTEGHQVIKALDATWSAAKVVQVYNLVLHKADE